MMADADGAGTHGKAAGLDPGFAKGDSVRGAEFSRKRRESKGATREGGGVKREGTDSASGSLEEFTAFHGASQRQRSEGATHKAWTHETGLGYPASLEHGAGNFVVNEMYPHAQFVIRGAQGLDMRDPARETPLGHIVSQHFPRHFQMHLNQDSLGQFLVRREINAVAANVHGIGRLFRISIISIFLDGMKFQRDFHDQTAGGAALGFQH